MKTSSLLFILSLASHQTILAAAKQTLDPLKGLDPALRGQYQPNASGTFKCLDGSLTIPYTAINDDYCDCPDGSDEPGTSACEGVGDQWFWCENKGHIPGKIRKSRVNDGLCDTECCDGSDEWATGACPNRCEEIGKVYREQMETETKTRRTGAKIRSTYVKFAQGERRRLEEQIKTKTSEVTAKEVEVENARLYLEKIEASSREALERKKGTPLYAFTLSQRLALSRLRAKTARLEAELDDLHGILDELTKNYNPNYSDMAVKAAVKGYEELTKPPEVVEGEAEGEKEDDEIQDKELEELEKKDLEGLLLLDDSDLEDEDTGLLYKLDEYIPDSIYEYWATIRDLTLDYLIKFGIIGKGSKPAVSSSEAPHVAAAREKHRTLTNELGKWRNEITGAEQTLKDMDGKYGPDAEWRKLDGTCIDKVSGDYTYELCFFGRATQKSNKDSSSNHLGTFSRWREGETEGSFEYYTTQHYENGAKCWNGPQRSVKVSLTCGTQNAILSISEPEKCEYLFTATSPALCWPIEGGEQASGGVKEEL